MSCSSKEATPANAYAQPERAFENPETKRRFRNLLDVTGILDKLVPLRARPATDEEIRTAFGASGGSLGPVGFKGQVLADEQLRDGQFVAGANRVGWHIRNVNVGRDFTPDLVADTPVAKALEKAQRAHDGN